MNNERSRTLLLRILSGLRAKTQADAYDLAGFNNHPRGRRLIDDVADGRLIVMHLAFDGHPESRFVKLLSGLLLRFSYHVWDRHRATAYSKICNCSGANEK